MSMSIGRCASTVLVAATFAAAGPLSHAVVRADDKDIKLTGCLLKGEGDGAGYLLTNSPAEPAWQRSADAHVAPSAVGTTGTYADIFYWLDGDSDLKRNVGHRVEIEGELKGDLKDGQIEMDRKDKWTEMTVKSDGRTMKARVPHTSIVAPEGEKDKKSRILVRKVDVSKVKMLAASCEQ
jgi:hypothetical protein